MLPVKIYLKGRGYDHISGSTEREGWRKGEREHSPEAVDALDRLEVRGLDVLDTQPATQTHTRTHTLYNDSEDMNVCVHARECVSVGALSQFQRFRAEEGETDMMSRK